MAAEDDFSFPATLDPRCGIDSPPLWRLSPAASPISSTANDRSRRMEIGGDIEIDRFDLVKFTVQRRRFSSGDDEAEKMDVLWENFNEELSRSRKSRLMKSAESMEEMVKARVVGAGSGGAVAPVRKKGRTVIVKVLKKLFLMHNNSRRNLQARSW